jgi:hypothetical protein
MADSSKYILIPLIDPDRALVLTPYQIDPGFPNSAQTSPFAGLTANGNIAHSIFIRWNRR